MIESLTSYSLYSALEEREVMSGCLLILGADYPNGDGDRKNALSFAAQLKRFRFSFLDRRSPIQNAPLLVQAARHRDAQRLRSDIVRAWLIGNHRSLLSAFLRASDIPEENGFVSGESPVPQKNQLRRGIGKIGAEFDRRTVAIYLAYLLTNGGDFWENLHDAVTPSDLAPLSEAPAGEVASAGGSAEADQAESESATVEDSTAFTTLDNLLIQRAVATATNETGALSEDQLEDLIEEVVELNSGRQHSFFHRGYFHALFSRSLEFSFRGENATRRLWYFAGAVMGLLRGSRKDSALNLLREQPELFGLLCTQDNRVAANMLLPQLFPILWDAKELAMAQSLLQAHAQSLTPQAFMPLVLQIFYSCAALLRRGQWEQAGWFLDFIGNAVQKRSDLPTHFREQFQASNDRKRAQVFQLKGDFTAAEGVLRAIAESGEGHKRASVLADLGLIRGKLRSLAATLPTPEEKGTVVLMDALASGRSDFETACQSFPEAATNAHFCLGLLDLLQAKSPRSAADHFRRALAGMLGKKEDYSEGGILQWTRFLLGVSLLEAGESADFQYARELLDGALADEINYPMWLWTRAMQYAAYFHDTSLATDIAGHLQEHRGSNAHRSIWESGLAVDVPSLRASYVGWLTDADMSLIEKWQQLTQLLPAALKHADIDQGENILDQMERIAEQAADLRSEFVTLLEDHRNYSPAWDIADSVHARSKLYELDNNSVQGIALMHQLFFQLLNEDNPSFPTAGPQIIEHVEELGAEQEMLAILRRHLRSDQEEDELSVDEDALREVDVRIIYVGGNETQAGYETKLRQRLAERFPKLELKTIFPGWGSNWIVYFDQVRGLLPKSDAVVLNKLVRTQFGRAVRRNCTSEAPWWPCTGKGLKALQTSIEAAARWAAAKKVASDN